MMKAVNSIHQPVMRRRNVDRNRTIKGYYVHEFARGFFGEQDEGRKMLRRMGLPADAIPFSAAVFLKDRKIRWKDASGRVASISFKLTPTQMECFGNYLGKRKSTRLFREWSSHEDSETVAKIESEAIGDLCMRCIYDNLFE